MCGHKQHGETCNKHSSITTFSHTKECNVHHKGVVKTYFTAIHVKYCSEAGQDDLKNKLEACIR